MFQQLIEAIRNESTQSGGTPERVKQAHSYRGRMHTAVGKKAQLKALQAKTRQQGKKQSLMPSAEPR